MVNSLRERLTDLIHDPEITKEQPVVFEERIRGNGKIVESRIMKSLFFLVVASAIWFLIKSAAINKLSFFGVEFEDFSVPLIVLPPIAAFFYYQYSCNVAIRDLINDLLIIYYSQMLQPIEKRKLIVSQ